MRLMVRMKGDGFARVGFGVAGIADDEGELGNDAYFAQTPRDGESLFGGDALLHLLEACGSIPIRPQRRSSCIRPRRISLRVRSE